MESFTYKNILNHFKRRDSLHKDFTNCVETELDMFFKKEDYFLDLNNSEKNDIQTKIKEIAENLNKEMLKNFKRFKNKKINYFLMKMAYLVKTNRNDTERNRLNKFLEPIKIREKEVDAIFIKNVFESLSESGVNKTMLKRFLEQLKSSPKMSKIRTQISNI